MIILAEIFYWRSERAAQAIRPFEVRLAGYTEDDQYRLTRVDSWQSICGYILDGQGTLVYNDRTYNLSPGDIFLLQIHSNHTYYADPRTPFRFLWFNAEGDLFSTLLEMYGLGQQVVIPQYDNPALFHEFHRICQTHTSEQEVFRLCGLLFHRMVAEWAEYMAGMEQAGSLAIRIKRYLDEHLNETVSLKKVSEQIGYSTAYIGRCFKEEYGMTPYQYLLGEKLAAAEKLLSQSDIKVHQVAELFGFNDEFHFSNAFYRHFGYRPKTLRKRKET